MPAICVETGCSMKRPIRIVEQLTGERHHVGVALRDDPIAKLRIPQEADSHRRDARLAPDPLREGHWEPLFDFLPLRARAPADPARRAVDHFYAFGNQGLRR